jgi:hypothetical protein
VKVATSVPEHQAVEAFVIFESIDLFQAKAALIHVGADA